MRPLFHGEKIMTALLCAALGGAMFYLSQGADDVWWLTWFAPVPLLWLAYGPARRWQVFAGSLAANACGQIYVAQTYGNAMPIAAMAVMIFGWGALFAVAILFARTVWQSFHRWRPCWLFQRHGPRSNMASA